MKHYIVPTLKTLLALLAVALFLCMPTASQAATVDEIISMQDSGVPADVIIKVIDSTGLDKPVDVDTIILLQQHGVDKAVLDYLAGLMSNENTPPAETGTDEADNSSDSNYMGGEFHGNYSGGNYNYEQSPQYSGRSGYWEGPGSGSGLYPPPGTISIYEPPVYMMGRHPYGAYYSPHIYGYDPNNPQGYYYYDPYYYQSYNNYPPYFYYDGNYSSGNWAWGYNFGRHHRSHDNHDFSVIYNDDHFGIRLHF